MYARSTTIRGVQHMDEGIAYIRDTVLPAMEHMSGCVGLSLMCDRAGRRCIATTAWADGGAMSASAETVKDMRVRSADMFGGQAEVQEWEIAIMHRLRDAPDGACARVTWARADGDQADRMIDTFRMGIIPQVDQLAGFCSVSLLVDREDGMCVLAATYESRDAMQRSADSVRDMRQQFTDEMGMHVTDMAEFELVLAHLRVPETV